ncbi:DUF4301 family protein [Robiginitalea sp. SC105]|uniref:DUF4301 family protein n=1 Tax=Robiginitalea sp. SC105 TaxID=2762332 RepID=UPI001639FD2B|nr:DUF4301 family protein [Robiginitalea sp. SC105]MBC2837946.1 DUF4301 family protein [Robiginitalea sp. SC105]
MEEALRQQPSGVLKVVLFGPESTGKTTLAKDLARHYREPWVPEYAREYLQDKWDRLQQTCAPEDLLPIARGQMELENRLARQAERLLVCDTDLLETKVYSETYYLGSCDPRLEEAALANRYDLYFLTDIDIPWEPDDLRDKPLEREEMFRHFQSALRENNRRFVILSGSRETRLETAVKHIDKLLDTMSNFTPADLEYMAEKGISPEKAEGQIETFREGIPPVRLHKAAVVGDGIVRFSSEEENRLQQAYRNRDGDLEVLKFIPASGAASRMFKALFNFLQDFDPETDSLEEYLAKPGHRDIRKFSQHLREFPFYGLVQSRIRGKATIREAELHEFVRELLSEDGLNYGFYPKGLLPFHNYDGTLVTPFEEHLYEGAAYASSGDTAALHFTISPQHSELFNKEFKAVNDRVSSEVARSFTVGYSFQKPSTDTIAVTPENTPFRDNEGRILFRPGGHGALIENLDEQDADLIFIKNIDNVVVRSDLGEVTRWKEILGGYLIELQQQAFSYSRMLSEGSLDHDLLNRIKAFLENRLNARFADGFQGLSIENQVAVLRDKLARPIRVCGMVRNEGEPGGGPFWITDRKGHESLQIIESAQVDTSDKEQETIFRESTHFNPVDLVCGVRDAYGEKYNLLNFVDEKQGFITDKTSEGRPLKALELPGLWNGGMAFWNTVFAEVPVSTFNPVKTVNDLLKPAHRTDGK